MIKILSHRKERLRPSNDSAQRVPRRYPRRHVDACVAVIDGKTFLVEDWSLGGALISADERLFAVGQCVDITMKFKLREKVFKIEHRAQIVRKSHDQIAFAFEPLTQRIRRSFQRVVDDFVARDFVNSQI